MSKLIPIDFEYNTTNEFRLNLVCCSFDVEGEPFDYWLYNNPSEWDRLKTHLLELREKGYILICFSAIAEGHSLISLGINPIRYRWLDVAQEWKMLTNHWHRWMYGKQLIDGRKVYTVPPTYGKDKTVNNSKPAKNLAAAAYKLLGVEIDTEHKTEMRDIIISNDAEKIEANKKAIMDYCRSDIKYLIPMWNKIKEQYLDYFSRAYDKTKKEMEELKIPFTEAKPVDITPEEVLFRGKAAARTAFIQATGYPVNVDKLKKFASSVKDLLKDLCEDINSQFDEDMRFFRWNNRDQRYSMYQKPLKEWIKNSPYADKWLMTPPSKTKPDGDYSLSLDAWEKHFSFRHDFPRGNVGAQLLRYLKTRQSLNGFLPKSKNAKNKETFFDSLGSDGRVRSFLNPYGAQSARFQPKATGFIPLKAAWMRSLIEPPSGAAICGIDYGSQEFLIAALVSGDRNMIEAYKSGDVYLYFAKLAGAVPWDGKKEDYKEARNVFKSTTLGISYSMGAAALAQKLSDDTGKPHTKEDAEKLISKFMEAYPDYAEWIDSIRFDYTRRRYHRLPDGWTIFGDNDNARSVSNVPIQGFGSCILRKAIEFCQDAGLKVIYPLHDALYIEYPSDNIEKIDIFAECMRKAFSFYFEDDMKKAAYELIRLDANIWSPDYEDGEISTPKGMICKKQKIYIDERSENEYKRFSKYWEV
jgi:hypothetical protein